MKLEAMPGDAVGREWIVLQDDKYIVATFHTVVYDSGDAQRNAEAFVESERIIRELRSAVEQLLDSYGLLLQHAPDTRTVAFIKGAFLNQTPEQYRQQIEKIIGKETK